MGGVRRETHDSYMRRETGDQRQENGEWRQGEVRNEKEGMRSETEEVRQEKGDRRNETEDGKQDKGDRIRVTGEVRQEK